MTDDNLYNVNVRINAKNGSVKFESIEVSEKFPVPIYDTNYVDYITFFSNKPLSKRLCQCPQVKTAKFSLFFLAKMPR